MHKILFNGHTIILKREWTPFQTNNDVTCETCSVPKIIADAVIFIVNNGVKKMTIDGAELIR